MALPKNTVAERLEGHKTNPRLWRTEGGPVVPGKKVLIREEERRR